MHEENTSQKTPKKSRKYIVFLVVGVLATIIANCFEVRNPNIYTFGGLVGVILLEPIIYFIILGLIALAVSTVRRNVRKYFFPIFAWLFLLAGLFDMGMKSYNEFILRPNLDKSIEELHRSGKLNDP